MPKKEINCILDCRISTTKQTAGVGLEEQEVIGRNYVDARGWNLVHTFSKVYSGRSEERQDFEDTLAFIKAEKRQGRAIQKYLIKSIDRFTRDGAVTYDEMKERLSARDVDLVDTYGIIQPKQNTLAHTGFDYAWSHYYPSETAELIEATRAKAEVRDILTRMIGAEIRYTKEGYHTSVPNDGFLNQKIMTPESKRKTIQVRDPKRAEYFESLYALRAEGILSDGEIVSRINAMGFRTKDHNKWDDKKEKIIGTVRGRPMTVKYLQKVIQNPIYAGYKLHKWGDYKPIRQNYPGLVSVDLFNQANRGKICIQAHQDGGAEVLYNHYPTKQPKRRMKYNPLYPFAKVIVCPECHRHFKASASRGKLGNYFPAYHCDRMIDGKRHYRRVPKVEFEQSVDAFLDKLKFTPAHHEAFSFALRERYRARENEILRTSSEVSRTIAELQHVKKREIEAFVASAGVPSIRGEIEKRIAVLDQQIDAAEGVQGKMTLQEDDLEHFMMWVDTIMEHPKETLTNNHDLEAQSALWSLVFDGAHTYEEICNGTPKLSRIFKLSSIKKGSKSSLVNPRGLEWNTIEETIFRWKDAFAIYGLDKHLLSVR